MVPVKNVMALFLVAGLVISGLVGCSGETKKSTTTTTGAAAASTEVKK